MEMEGSGGSQSQLIHPAVDVDEAAALGVTKRARKRSRYLSPPYTMDTDVQEEKAAGSHKQREEEEEEEGPPNVSSAEVLSALRATTLGQWEGMGMDPAALRFLAMYTRNRNSVFVNGHCDSHAAAGGGSQDDGGNKPPSLSAAGVMLNLNVGPDDGSLAKKNPHPPAPAGASANAKQQKENAAVLEHAIIATHGHGHASQSPGFVTTATHGHPNPPLVATTAVTSLVHNEKKKKRRRSKKRFKTIGQHSYSYSYVGSPVALVLDFAEGTPLPSREDLFSTFSRFGVVIDSETSISQDKRTARVAFATRAQAESALSCAATLGGAFGPSFAVASLQDLALNTPLPKLPLPVIRNNLGKMIVSLSSKATVDSLSLVGEMQRLLAKVDKALQVQRASAAAHHA